MRVRIIRPLSGEVDGVDLSRYLLDRTYEMGATLGTYLLAQEWAVPASEQDPLTELPFHRSPARPGVLIVEDDQDMRLILSDLLLHNGWISHAAADGEQGLAALQEHRPALILLDLMMPRMSGEEFRAAQRQLPDRRLAQVPVVVVSAMDDAPRYKSALQASAVLVKPFEADRLLEAIEHYARPSSLLSS